MYSWLDATKDFLGAIGPIFIAVPWFAEFNVKRLRERLKKIDTKGSLSDWKKAITESLSENLHSPKYRDVVWTLLGLTCICASFVIALLANVKDLF